MLYRDLKTLFNLRYSSIWIGLSDLDIEGTWRWVGPYPSTNGTYAARSTRLWSTGEPKRRTFYSGTKCHCAMIFSSFSILGYAESWPCTFTMGYLCEKPL